MSRSPTSRAVAGGLVMMAALLLLAAAARSAFGAVRGRTSQHLKISFTINQHALRRLDFRVDDRCPSGRVWRVHDFNFPPIRITRSKFDARFKSLDGRASAEVKGRVFDHRVTGTLRDRTLIAQEGDYCNGTASFTIRR